jgi:hypothetical protein
MKFAPEAKLLIANADGGSRLSGAVLSGGRGTLRAPLSTTTSCTKLARLPLHDFRIA